MIKRFIKVQFQKEGIHRYPFAENIEGVEFLAHPHRHIFHFNVKVEVFHDDRDIEFILLKRELEGLYESNMDIDHKSCEMLALELVEYIKEKYPNRIVEVYVFEDNENGGGIEYAP